MKLAAAVLTLIVASAVLSFAEGSKTYVGVITDSMCAGDHAAMKIMPEAKCVKECARRQGVSVCPARRHQDLQAQRSGDARPTGWRKG